MTLIATITPHDLRAAALSGEELAVIDVREGDAYVANGHTGASRRNCR
jgi:rhodanese-related sulfurtransferase